MKIPQSRLKTCKPRVPRGFSARGHISLESRIEKAFKTVILLTHCVVAR